MMTIDHPAQSPDINPIEHLWKHLKEQINKQAEVPKSAEELWEVISDEWRKIDIDFINQVIESMPERVGALLKAKGGPTKY